MKRYFFIDQENTGNRFLKGLKELNKGDVVVLFHSDTQGDIKNEILMALIETKATVEIKKMKIHTKNAMDFQICTYLGYLFKCHGTKAEYYIVSDDKGYEAGLEFIKMHLNPEAKIERIDCNMLAKEEEGVVELLLKGKYKKKIINRIVAGVKESSNKCEFHNFLQKNFGSDFEKIYQLVKPVFDEAKVCYM